MLMSESRQKALGKLGNNTLSLDKPERQESKHEQLIFPPHAIIWESERKREGVKERRWKRERSENGSPSAGLGSDCRGEMELHQLMFRFRTAEPDGVSQSVPLRPRPDARQGAD